jgi:hypothetical protein
MNLLVYKIHARGQQRKKLVNDEPIFAESSGTHDPVAQKSKGTQKACTNVPQKALLYFEVSFLNVSMM